LDFRLCQHYATDLATTDVLCSPVPREQAFLNTAFVILSLPSVRGEMVTAATTQPHKSSSSDLLRGARLV
jgi:hypothetical protein